MGKFTQNDFEAARLVLEFMLQSTQTHEPYAINDIAEMEAVLGMSFDKSDYPA